MSAPAAGKAARIADEVSASGIAGHYVSHQRRPAVRRKTLEA